MPDPWSRGVGGTFPEAGRGVKRGRRRAGGHPPHRRPARAEAASAASRRPNAFRGWRGALASPSPHVVVRPLVDVEVEIEPEVSDAPQQRRPEPKAAVVAVQREGDGDARLRASAGTAPGLGRAAATRSSTRVTAASTSHPGACSGRRRIDHRPMRAGNLETRTVDIPSGSGSGQWTPRRRVMSGRTPSRRVTSSGSTHRPRSTATRRTTASGRRSSHYLVIAIGPALAPRQAHRKRRATATKVATAARCASRPRPLCPWRSLDTVVGDKPFIPLQLIEACSNALSIPTCIVSLFPLLLAPYSVKCSSLQKFSCLLELTT